MAGYPALLHDPVVGTSRRVTIAWDPGSGGALRIEGDGLDHAVPATRLSLAGGGFTREAIHLTWEEQGRVWAVTVQEPQAVATLTRALPARFTTEVAGLRRDTGRRRRRRGLALTILLLVVLLPIFAAVSLYLLRDRILDAVSRRLPVSVDARLGDLAHQQVAASGKLVSDGPSVEAVRAIGARLLAGAPGQPFTFRFEVVRDRSINAFAAPGGLIVVHTGLLAGARSADELAGVLAHEVTHVLARHSLRQLLFQLGLTASVRLVLGMPEGVADTIASAAVNLGSLRFSRDQERDADRGGVELLARARLPATGLQSFFDRLARQEGAVPALLSSHPPSAERVVALKRLLDSRGSWTVEPLGLDWDAVRRDAKAQSER